MIVELSRTISLPLSCICPKMEHRFQIIRRSEARPIGPIAQALIEKLEKALPADVRDQLADADEGHYAGAGDAADSADQEPVGAHAAALEDFGGKSVADSAAFCRRARSRMAG